MGMTDGKDFFVHLFEKRIQKYPVEREWWTKHLVLGLPHICLLGETSNMHSLRVLHANLRKAERRYWDISTGFPCFDKAVVECTSPLVDARALVVGT